MAIRGSRERFGDNRKRYGEQEIEGKLHELCDVKEGRRGDGGGDDGCNWRWGEIASGDRSQEITGDKEGS